MYTAGLHRCKFWNSDGGIYAIILYDRITVMERAELRFGHEFQ